MRFMLIAALVAAGILIIRADVQLARMPGGAAVSAADVDSTATDAYCLQSQADGCWPQATDDPTRIVATRGHQP